MGVRSYAPALGRFLTPDPVMGGSANPYDYANQDPINLFDLNGEKICTTVHSVNACGGNAAAMVAERNQLKRRYNSERRTAHRLANGPRTIVLMAGHRGGATSSSIFDALESAANHVIKTVGGGVKTVFNGAISIKLTGPEYKAAGEAFNLAEAWNPSRLIQVWQCGTWLGGGVGDCDPFEIATGEPTATAR